MRLIADSGSSKTDWAILDGELVVAEFKTLGINPFFRTSEDITSELQAIFSPYRGAITTVNFYGAGIIDAAQASVVGNALRPLLGDVPMEIASDMLGAARALSGDCMSVVCILGTGSNACLYDGKQLQANIPPMGFILGDEASGAVLGRQLVGDYFKQVMPESMRKKFYAEYQLEKADVIEHVYRMEKPNKYLAQFAKFLNQHIAAPYCQDLLANQFGQFIDRNILQLPNAQNFEVNCVGSIAYHFQQQLKAQLEIRGLRLGTVLQSPIEGLKIYHRS
ncbi:MAG: ATPase [Mangrovibacterium sp.]